MAHRTLFGKWYSQSSIITATFSHCRYMQHDNDPTFSDFKVFGGWNKLTMKQYSEDSKDCVANLNLDYSV